MMKNLLLVTMMVIWFKMKKKNPIAKDLRTKKIIVATKKDSVNRDK